MFELFDAQNCLKHFVELIFAQDGLGNALIWSLLTFFGIFFPSENRNEEGTDGREKEKQKKKKEEKEEEEEKKKKKKTREK